MRSRTNRAFMMKNRRFVENFCFSYPPTLFLYRKSVNRSVFMRNARHILLCVLALGTAACSERELGPIGPDPTATTTVTLLAERNAPVSRTSLFDEPIEIGGDSAEPQTADNSSDLPATRTTLEADWLTTKWNQDDCIAVWAADGAGNYTLSDHVFHRFVQTGTSTAVFTSDIPAMPAGSYGYRAFYPVPEAARIDGTRLTYTLPAVQDGTYRAELDVLSSEIVEGPSLTDKSRDEELLVAMRHRFHALRIRIPTGRNHRGAPVTRLLIDFPREVAGDATFDVADPAAAPVLTNGSRRIDLQLKKPLDVSPEAEPQYVWVFVAPGELDGAISFTPLFADGFCAETLSASVRKTMAGGRVTPVDLTVSAVEQPLTWIDFTIDHTQLGEPVDKLTVTAPEGVRFRSGTVLPVTGGRCSLSYYGILYNDRMQGAGLALAYDSQHALVSNSCTLPASLNEGARNAIAIKAPYLFFEDFSLLQGYDIYGGNVSDQKQEGQFINDRFHTSGWTGSQTYGTAGKAIAIRTRHETRLSEYRGRVDSAPFENIKERMNVKVKVSFDYGSSWESGAATCSMNYGYTTTEGPIEAYGYRLYLLVPSEWGNKVDPATNVPLTDNSGSTDSVKQHIDNFVISGCSNKTRLSWDCSTNRDNSNSKNAWLYLDNIRVSIAQ